MIDRERRRILVKRIAHEKFAGKRPSMKWDDAMRYVRSQFPGHRLSDFLDHASEEQIAELERIVR